MTLSFLGSKPHLRHKTKQGEKVVAEWFDEQTAGIEEHKPGIVLKALLLPQVETVQQVGCQYAIEIYDNW